MAEIVMDKYEVALVEKHGFQVSADKAGTYIVIDPDMPKRKNRYKGGNLYALLLLALDERKRLNKDTEKKPEVKSVKSNIINHQFEKVNVAIKVDTEVKLMKQGKLYFIKTMILENPTITNDEIFNKLKADGTSSPLSTIMSVRADFLSTINLLKGKGRFIEKP